MRLKLLHVLIVAMSLPAASWAQEVQLNCITKRDFVRDGNPPAMLVTFDEKSGSASLIATNLGGVLKGEGVVINDLMIAFRFTTQSNEQGEATVMRDDGTLMVKVKRQPSWSMLATCRKQANKF